MIFEGELDSKIAFILTMFTIKQIQNGSGYFKNYLAVTEYYTQGSKASAYWIGKGSELLGLSGNVAESDFRAIASNKHPETGARLTQRTPKNSLHDITFSAPKAVSILAVLGEDVRVGDAFKDAAEYAHRKMEAKAAVRVRGGAQYHTESIRFTENVVTAVFLHDDSRALDPQLHAHLVTGNCTYDVERDGWYALQSRFMMESTKSPIRDETNQFLARKLRQLGYAAESKNGTIAVVGINREMEKKMSQRSCQRERFEERYRNVFGEAPSKRRVEYFIKEGKEMSEQRFRAEYEAAFGSAPTSREVESFSIDWRETKSAAQIPKTLRQQQIARWTAQEWDQFQQIVVRAKGNSAASTNERAKGATEQLRPEAVRQNSKTSKRVEQPQKAQKKQTRRKHRRLQSFRQGRALSLALRGHPGLALAQVANRKAWQRRQR